MDFQKTLRDIKSLKIQGAEHIALSGVRALKTIVHKSKARTSKEFLHHLNKARKDLISIRPTEPFLRNCLSYIFSHSKEKELRAIEWIEKFAREYRKIWEKEIIDREFSEQRCPDCPLSESSILGHCQIHDRWLELLQQYANDEINSKKYVENTLKLLSQHKENLKIKLNVLKEIG